MGVREGKLQKSTSHFINISVNNLPLQGPVFEFGSMQVHEEVSTGEPRAFFRNKGFEYIGCDMRAGKGVDQVQNLHALDIEDNSVGCVVCMDTLEHVEYPRKAMAEMWRVLKTDGIAIMSSVFQFPIHGYPNDFWRFTPEGFRSLFSPFHDSLIYSFGLTDITPQVVAGIGFKSKKPRTDDFETAAKNWEIWNTTILQDLQKMEAEGKAHA